MKRLVLIISLILMLLLAACDTMGPTQQEVIPTDGAPGETAAVPQEQYPAPDTPSGETTGTTTGETAEGTGDVAGADLQATTWEWVSQLDPMGQTTAADPTRYTIVFNSDGTANITADCNVATGTFLTDGVNLNIEPGATTAAACPEGSQDQLFLTSLAGAESYVVEDEELFITLRGGAGTLIFRSSESAGSSGDAAAPALAGTTWEWVSTTTPTETITVSDPTRYTVLFNADGTAGMMADCNGMGATYSAGEDGTLSVILGAGTLMACPEDSQADLFTGGMANATGYSFEGRDLVIELGDGAGTMRFRAAGGGVDGQVGDTELQGIVWEWVSTTTGELQELSGDPSLYTIAFGPDGMAGIKADCNVGNAEYTAGEDGSLSITLGIFTMAFCENPQDQIFRNGLAAAALYYIDGGDLFIDLVDDGGTMRFRNGGAAEQPAPAPGEGDITTGGALTGVAWEWVRTVTPVEEITVADPTRYHIVLNDDNTANIKADCNVGTAIFSTSDSNAITITPGAMTLALCPEDSQAAQFMAGLGGAAVYFFQDGNLMLDMVADSGTMHFRAGDAVAEDPPLPETGAGGESSPTPEPGRGPAVQPIRPSSITGLTWNLGAIETASGTVTINDPSRYTVVFNADGTANVQADCNVGSMGYTTGADGALTMTPGPMTRAFCGAGSFDQMFLGGLTNAMTYRIEGSNLYIDMLYESGTLFFAPTQ